MSQNYIEKIIRAKVYDVAVETPLDHYTPGQQKVERGFRFLKDPWFIYP